MALAMTVAYDGSAFSGFQYQPRGATVQGTLEEALWAVTGVCARVQGASRTDAGVHAQGQVAVWRTEAVPVPLDRLAAVLNRRLPPTIRVRDVRTVPASFDPRRSRAKVYSYRVVAEPPVDPFWVGRVAVAPTALALGPLNAWAALYVGRHDFGGFRHQGSSAGTTVRQVFASHWVAASPGSPGWVYWVTGDGFLYHMVRLMVGAMWAAASAGCADPIARALEHPEHVGAFQAAPARGLCLEQVWF